MVYRVALFSVAVTACAPAPAANPAAPPLAWQPGPPAAAWQSAPPQPASAHAETLDEWRAKLLARLRDVDGLSARAGIDPRQSPWHVNIAAVLDAIDREQGRCNVGHGQGCAVGDPLCSCL